MEDWIRTDERLPEPRLIVEAMDSGGHVQTLMRDGGLWWFPDHSMYVYFTPTFWKLANGVYREGKVWTAYVDGVIVGVGPDRAVIEAAHQSKVASR